AERDHNLALVDDLAVEPGDPFVTEGHHQALLFMSLCTLWYRRVGRKESNVDLDLKGKKAIVTGGTRGIGRAIAELLTDEGCDVAVCARGRAGIDETRASLAGKGVKAFGGTVDVADRQALRGWVEEAAGSLGGLHIFVANVSALERAWA